jgi:uncharacterized membrane-anchored protein
VFGLVKDGATVRVHDGGLYDGEHLLLTGNQQDDESIGASMAEARAGLSTQLEAFAANTMEYLLRERDMLLDGVGVPDIATRIEGGTRSSWCGATTTARTSRCSSPTSASTGRCSSASTAAPTR